ncbi:uncharacterized protein N7515_009233 [Penicillium bovifimosum]|uniref:Uncharacterized protein n=1 Tax=Penicillium bovifimosum TaxID=126998 RepID=A0A9W9GK67_9EURO|nr:uncharacterized protein N7515_009233 [Penicillium bovifimosum]KAJ5121272.1 hypothetical protein N7515_009233 [Penicillium bovifimosum]
MSALRSLIEHREMRNLQRTPYGVVPVEEYQLERDHSSEFQYSASIDLPTDEQKLQPQPLRLSRLDRVSRLLWDLLLAVMASLFAVFGIWVSRVDGSPAGPGSIGSKLYEISQYAPTVFPVLFAAIAGSSIKSIASWRIQTPQGATIGLVEQCLGSQTITGAFLTQIRLRAVNLMALFTVLLWCLSPLGSQASLRVISIVTSHPGTAVQLTTLDTFTPYQYGFSQGLSEAMTIVANPMIASISAASLLSTRNQDLWSNVRFPIIEHLKGDTEWMDVPPSNNMSYASLVGTPVSGLPDSGSTSFTLPGAYMSLSCPVFDTIRQINFTNFTGPDAPSPGNDDDCSWSSSQGGNQFQIAISEPCSASNNASMTRTRNARKMIWESWAPGYAGAITDRSPITRAICDLTTTYVDANVTCGSLDGHDSTNTCNLSSARRSVDSHFHSNWTVLDVVFPGDEKLPPHYPGGILYILTNMFPHAEGTGGLQPVLEYFVDPFHAVGKFDSDWRLAPDTIDRQVFETRFAQLFNSVLYLGISPSAFTGSFNITDIEGKDSEIQDSPVKLTAQNIRNQDVVKCNRPWLAVLIISSLVIFCFALVGAYLHIVTIAPELLGSVSVALLRNKIEGVTGSSTWSSDEWSKNLQDTKLYLGDVQPDADVGCIALTTSAQDVPAASVKGRLYI